MTDYARTLGIQLFVDWNFDTTYTDESSRVISASGSLRLTPPESAIFSPRGTADRCVVTLDNKDGRYSSLLTTGALYSDLQGGGAYHAPMYLRVTTDGGSNYYNVFYGVVKIPDESTPTSRELGQITLDCRSIEEQVLSKRINTPQADFKSWFDTPKTESQIMAEILTDAGIGSGERTLDDGLFFIPWAWVDNESAIEACWSLAAACGGRFYSDLQGQYVYENATHWLKSPHNTSQATLTRGTYKSLRPYYDDREIYQSVTVQATPRHIDVQETIWEADAVYSVPANTTGSTYVNITAELANPGYIIDAPTYDAVTAGGTDLTSSVTCTVTEYAQRVLMQFQNSHATQAADIVNLKLTGQMAKADLAITTDLTSADSFWTNRDGRTRALTGNRWIQTQSQADYLAEFLRDRHETPRLFFKVEGYWAAGSSERRLGDRITINDTSIMSSSRDAFIIAIDWKYDSNGGYTQDLTCIDATDLYAYIDSSPTYFVIGTNKLGTADPDRGRVFY